MADITEEDALAEGFHADQPQTWWQGYWAQSAIEDWRLADEEDGHRPRSNTATG